MYPSIFMYFISIHKFFGEYGHFEVLSFLESQEVEDEGTLSFLILAKMCPSRNEITVLKDLFCGRGWGGATSQTGLSVKFHISLINID